MINSISTVKIQNREGTIITEAHLLVDLLEENDITMVTTDVTPIIDKFDTLAIHQNVSSCILNISPYFLNILQLLIPCVNPM